MTHPESEPQVERVTGEFEDARAVHPRPSLQNQQTVEHRPQQLRRFLGELFQKARLGPAAGSHI